MDEPAYPDPASRRVLEPNCTRCPALVDSRQCIAWGNGPDDAAVMVVGEAPAAGDPEADRWRGGNLTGLAYTARHSGRLIRALMADAGFGPDRVFYTNAVKCHPAGPDGDGRPPTDHELDRCWAHLRTELETVEPTVVVTTGRHATRQMLGREGIELDGFVERVLEPVACPTLGVTVLPLLHPAYQHVWISRLGYDRPGYVAALRSALRRRV